MIMIRTFNNSINNQRKLESDSRQLVPLKRILDNAAAKMVRLEALKTNFKFSLEHPESYTREGVKLYYEEALRALTDLADGETRGAFLLPAISREIVAGRGCLYWGFSR